MSSLLPLFRWFDSTWVNRVINDSTWLFPAIEAVHIVALALLFGAILLLNLRILGLTLRSRPLPQLKRELAPWILSSLIVILTSGALLFTSEAVKSYFSFPFWIKMAFLAGAILIHYAIQGRLIRPDGQVAPVWGKLSATLSLVLWFGVGFAGRAIGFF
jgi:hypothetical protein